LISSMPEVEYQRVIATMDACLRAGFQNVMFGINPEAPATPTP